MTGPGYYAQDRYRTDVKKITKYLDKNSSLVAYLSAEEGNVITPLGQKTGNIINDPMYFLSQLQKANDWVQSDKNRSEAQKKEAMGAYLKIQDAIIKEANEEETKKYARLVNKWRDEKKGITRLTSEEETSTLAKQGYDVVKIGGAFKDSHISVYHGKNEQGQNYVEIKKSAAKDYLDRNEAVVVMALAKIGPSKTIKIEPLDEKRMEKRGNYYKEKRDLMFRVLYSGMNINEAQLKQLNKEDYKEAQNLKKEFANRQAQNAKFKPTSKGPDLKLGLGKEEQPDNKSGSGMRITPNN